jgi:hypothetical protein
MWSKRADRGMTALGVQADNDVNSNDDENSSSTRPYSSNKPSKSFGVLVPVNDTELEQFDVREQTPASDHAPHRGIRTTPA